MATEIKAPFDQYTNKVGTPLNAGKIYIGVAGMNPETNQISLYWDSAFTSPAPNPATTSGGLIYRNGTPAKIFCKSSNYSITVKDSKGLLVYSNLNTINKSVTFDSISDLATINPSSIGSNTVVIGDIDRGGVFTWSSTAIANGGTIFAGATGYWNRQFDGAVNVKWFGLTNDISSDINRVLQYYNTVVIDAGIYTYASQIELRSGQSVIGVKPSEIGTGYATTGTNFVSNASYTGKCFNLDDGTSAPLDNISIIGIGFDGNNNSSAIYCNDTRSCTFKDLIFYNYTKCFHMETENWLNNFSNIKAFNFDRFVYFNSGGEDTTFNNCIARGYRVGSVGVYVNYFSQTMYFNGCDLSECGTSYLSNISSGNHLVVFNSCYFELADQTLDGAIYLNSGASSEQTAIMNGCRFYFKGTTVTDSKALYSNGNGKNEFISNGCKYDDVAYIVKDGNNGSLQKISGDGNINNSIVSIFSNTSNSLKELGFIGIANIDNLLSLNKSYYVVHDFTTPFTIDMASVGNFGKWSIEITGNNEPINNASFIYQPKSYFSSGKITELFDADSVFTASASGTSFTISASGGGNRRLLIKKII